MKHAIKGELQECCDEPMTSFIRMAHIQVQARILSQPVSRFDHGDSVSPRDRAHDVVVFAVQTDRPATMRGVPILQIDGCDRLGLLHSALFLEQEPDIFFPGLKTSYPYSRRFSIALRPVRIARSPGTKYRHAHVRHAQDCPAARQRPTAPVSPRRTVRSSQDSVDSDRATLVCERFSHPGSPPPRYRA